MQRALSFSLDGLFVTMGPSDAGSFPNQGIAGSGRQKKPRDLASYPFAASPGEALALALHERAS